MGEQEEFLADWFINMVFYKAVQLAVVAQYRSRAYEQGLG